MNRHHNDQRDLQITKQKTKDRTTRTSLKTGGLMFCEGSVLFQGTSSQDMKEWTYLLPYKTIIEIQLTQVLLKVSSPCSTSGARHITLVTNPTISHVNSSFCVYSMPIFCQYVYKCKFTNPLTNKSLSYRYYGFSSSYSRLKCECLGRMEYVSFEGMHMHALK